MLTEFEEWVEHKVSVITPRVWVDRLPPIPRINIDERWRGRLSWLMISSDTKVSSEPVSISSHTWWVATLEWMYAAAVASNFEYDELRETADLLMPPSSHRAGCDVEAVAVEVIVPNAWASWSMVWYFAKHSLHAMVDLHDQTLWRPRQLKQSHLSIANLRRFAGESSLNLAQLTMKWLASQQSQVYADILVGGVWCVDPCRAVNVFLATGFVELCGWVDVDSILSKARARDVMKASSCWKRG